MKKTLLISALSLFFSLHGQAQTNSNKPKMALIEIDIKEFQNTSNYDLGNITSITRLELEKLNLYQIMSKYDIDFIIKKDSLDLSNCFSSFCIEQATKKLGCDKMLTGSISNLSGKIVIIFKVYDAKTQQFEKQIVKEYLDFPMQLTKMIRYSLQEMHGIATVGEGKNALSNEFDFDEVKNNPHKSRLRSDGPRMGLTYFTGETARILKDNRQNGGYNVQPLMFQFGYQFEKQYLNEGNFQALFEFLPMITGLDQGMFIPSFTLLNGLRNNKTGFEFAFGPSISFVKKIEGYYSSDGNWVVSGDSSLRNTSNPNYEYRLDSRGAIEFQPSFIFAVGKTFKSGKLNIPVNAYFIPSNNGFRLGISFGFNSKPRFETD